MLLIVGLGNPGSQYAENRHNVGFMAVDEIVRRHNFLPPRTRFQALTYEGMLGGRKVMIIKPQGYMNKSGHSVQLAAKFYKVPPENVIVIYDELDLAPGKIKTKLGGGAAGHNGIRSLTQHIGADFHRVRIGIGHPGNQKLVHSHVLGDFYKIDLEWLDPLLQAMAEEAHWLGLNDITRFQSEVARRLNPNSPSPDPKKEKQETAAQKPASTNKIRTSAAPSGPLADAMMKFRASQKKKQGDK